MQKANFIILSLLFITATAFVTPVTTNWTIDNKYSIKFTAGENKGTLRGLKGTIQFDENDMAGSVFNVTFDVNTIDLGDEERTNQAKEKDWLDAANHPTIGFTSSAFIKTAKGFEVRGHLKIKGISKDMSFPFTFTKKTKAGVFKGAFTIYAADYKISNEGIGEEIKINFTIPVKES
ncbi:MAG TPA: YceI family protein [Flavobacteriales bacterium]|nr:YceI family protein [Flavobacteriales bacterium]